MESKACFLLQMQKKVAVSAVGASVVRGQPTGTIKNARLFLENLSLRITTDQTAQPFDRWLDKATDDMRPIPWGVARKCLNLFLRDAFYNHFLHVEYKLHPLGQLLEVPLDSVVGGYLIKHPKNGGRLISWPTLKGLKPDQSRAFQEVASEIAKAGKFARVHLDLFAWVENR